MYVLNSAVGVLKFQGARYKSVDISAVAIKDLLSLYRAMYIKLTNNQLSGFFTISLEQFRTTHTFYTGTIGDYLSSLGNATLTTLVQPVTLNPKYVYYEDAIRAGYKMTPVNILAANDAEQPASARTSIRITRPGYTTDMEVFYKNCLVTVNGFFHRTDYDGTSAYAIEGNSSRLKSHANQVGLHSFRSVGEIEQVPITPSMIFKEASDSLLKTRCYIKLNKNLTNKTVILVLGGYMLFIDGNSFWQQGDDIFGLDFQRLPYVERYLEAAPYVNFDSLDLPHNSSNPSSISVNDLMSDATITKYLGLAQSFFVIVSTPEMFRNKITIKPTGTPGCFIGYKDPIYPLFTGLGKVSEYWKVYEDGQWAINCANSVRTNRVASTIPVSTLNVVTDNNVPNRPGRPSTGYLLEMGRDF